MSALFQGLHRQNPAQGRVLSATTLAVQLVLDVQLGTTVLRTAFRIVGTIRVGVRSNRTALAVADRTDQTRRIDAVLGQVVVHGGRTTLGQLLVVRVGTLRVGVTGNLDLQVG